MRVLASPLQREETSTSADGAHIFMAGACIGRRSHRGMLRSPGEINKPTPGQGIQNRENRYDLGFRGFAPGHEYRQIAGGWCRCPDGERGKDGILEAFLGIVIVGISKDNEESLAELVRDTLSNILDPTESRFQRVEALKRVPPRERPSSGSILKNNFVNV
jgi:hypothetical protein